jgi:thiol:disulfide interchange protein DsbD
MGGEMIEQIQYLLQEAFRQDTIGLYFLMFGGGLFASVTPCTYPVLPLTVGYIGNQAGANRFNAFLLSISLVTGLATVYAVLGAIVAAAGGTFGSIMGKGFVLYGVAFFYLLMGLFLLDLFRLPSPQFFSRLQAKSANSKGILGAFVIGGVSGLIVGPCTGPILAVALGSIALMLKDVQGAAYALQVAKGGFLLFLFGFGQGALILIAGSFTGFLSRLPKAGAWMETVKKGFALSIIVASTLLFVFVGQNTDFPSLTRLLAGPSSPTASAPMPAVSKESQSPAKEDSSANPAPDFTLPAASTPMPAVSKESQPPAKEDSSANPAPDFTLASLDGPQVTLSSYRGRKGVVLVFFATWCVPCMKEVPAIKRFTETAQKERIEVLAVNYKQQKDIIERFTQSNKVNYRILLDAEGTVTEERYGIKGLPHLVGVDATGKIVYRGIDLPADQDEFMRNLQQGL